MRCGGGATSPRGGRGRDRGTRELTSCRSCSYRATHSVTRGKPTAATVAWCLPNAALYALRSALLRFLQA